MVRRDSPDLKDEQALLDPLALPVFKVRSVSLEMPVSRVIADREVVQDLQATEDQLVQRAAPGQMEQPEPEVSRAREVSLDRLARKAHREMVVTLDRLDSPDRSDHPVKSDNLVSKDPEVTLVMLDRKVRWDSLERSACLVSLVSRVVLVPRVCQDLRVQSVHLDSRVRLEVKESRVIRDSPDNQDNLDNLDHRDSLE